MSTTRTFDIADLVTTTTGRMVTARGYEAIRDVVDYVTGEPHMLHQLPRAATDVVIPELLRQHPWLAGIAPPAVSSEAEAIAWRAAMVREYGAEHHVEPLPEGEYVGREPVAEFREMNPRAVIVGDAATLPNDLGGGTGS